jgi:hypothetical protein
VLHIWSGQLRRQGKSLDKGTKGIGQRTLRTSDKQSDNDQELKNMAGSMDLSHGLEMAKKSRQTS